MKNSFQILHSFLLIVFLSFILETIKLPVYLNELPFTLAAVLFTTWVIGIFIIKVIFYAGVYGTLIEFVSGEEFVLDYARFKNNIKKFWKFCVIVFGVLAFEYFLFSQDLALHSILKAYLNFSFLFFLVIKIVSIKYLKPFNIQHDEAHITWRTSLSIGVLFVFYAVFSLTTVFFQSERFFIAQTFSILAQQYIHFLTFIFFADIYLQQNPKIIQRFKSEKELFLIAPPFPDFMFGISSLFLRFRQPVFAVLKALTPVDYKIREFTCLIWRERFYKKGVLVAITCYSSNSFAAYKIAKEFRKRGSIVIMGGPHVSLFPQEALSFCDSVIVGEVEGIWEEVLQDYEQGILKKIYTGKNGSTQEHQRIHDYLLNVAPVAEVKALLHTKRGCKYHCYFCSRPMLSSDVYQKQVQDVIALINKIKKESNFVNFLDENIYSDPGYAKELFEALKPLRIKWAASCSLDIAKNEPLLRLAKESGCQGFLVGYEVSSDSPEKNQKGKFGMAYKFLELSKALKKKGISIKAHFIFGFEKDDFRSLLQLWWFCFRLFPLFTALSILTPMPGSQLYRDMLKANRLSNLNWRYYDCSSLVFKHKKMNNFLLRIAYPFLYAIFLFTTSFGGFGLLVIILQLFWIENL